MSEELQSSVLVVDDTEANIDILVDLLGDIYDVSVALDGRSALSSVVENPPDLILLDIMMPEIDGYQVCRKLKESQKYQHIPVIFITAKSESEDIIKGFETGAVDYVTKPFNPPELLARVGAHLEVLASRKKIEKQKQELIETNETLRSTQNQLIESEKMAALGQLVAGIAHEINTPFGAINSSVEFIKSNFDLLIKSALHLTANVPEIEQLLDQPQTNEKYLSTLEARKVKKEFQAKLEQNQVPNPRQLASKIVDAGYTNLDAELLNIILSPNANDALALILTLKRQYRSINNITLAVKRVSKLIFALKNYSRKDLSNEGKTPISIPESLEMVLMLYHNQIKQGVEVEMNLQIPQIVPCYENEIAQVWTNLIYNALQAMENKGTLTISGTQNETETVVTIGDSGSGIPEEIQSKIFNPFFTTKPAGEGTGLGLDIVKRIVDKHGGQIDFKSQPGSTVFTVKLPNQ